MTQIKPQMIADLARVAARYTPEDWERLIDAVNDEARRAEFTSVLRELVAASRTHRSRGGGKQTGRAQRVREAVANIRRTDPARADLLEDVWRKLRQRELLPTMALVRTFAEATGLKGLNSPKRDQAVTELMAQIVEMPISALERMMRETVVHDRKLGEEYERWVDLILRRPTPGSDETGEGFRAADSE